MAEQYTLRGHHLRSLDFFLKVRDGAFEISKRTSKYGKDFDNAAIILHNSILSDYSNQVLLISNLDAICNAGNGCPIKNKSCSSGYTSAYDKMFIEMYGFKEGKQYSVEDLVYQLSNNSIYSYPSMLIFKFLIKKFSSMGQEYFFG